jgi:hypothetical protein
MESPRAINSLVHETAMEINSAREIIEKHQQTPFVS